MAGDKSQPTKALTGQRTPKFGECPLNFIIDL
jgi:hypothetical protein